MEISVQLTLLRSHSGIPIKMLEKKGRNAYKHLLKFSVTCKDIAHIWAMDSQTLELRQNVVDRVCLGGNDPIFTQCVDDFRSVLTGI